MPASAGDLFIRLRELPEIRGKGVLAIAAANVNE
jgi:hypothetical protein